MIMGKSESLGNGGGKTDLNNFGWGDRIEEWISPDGGANWERWRTVSPQRGMRYQNLRHVATSDGGQSNEIFLFYGWNADSAAGEATAFLWDDRPSELGYVSPLRSMSRQSADRQY